MPNLRGKTWTTTTPANVEDAQYWEDHLISDTAALKAASSVQSVNSITPDAQGNVDVVALPAGGTAGQVLTKQSSTTGDADWEDPASSGHTIEDEDGNIMPYQSTLQFENAEVTNDSVNNKTIVDCKGSKGDAATITVGTVTTLPAGSDATVTNSGTSSDAVFDFGIPKGADGEGAVDSVNGYTGVVVLDASDVGALPDSTTIPTKTSELDNDSGFVTSSAIPTSLSELSDDTTHRLVTDAEKTNWDAKVSESLLKDTVGWVGKNLASSFMAGSQSQYDDVLFIDGDLKADTEYTISFDCDGAFSCYYNNNLFTTGPAITTVVGSNSITLKTKSAISKSTINQYISGKGWRVLKNSVAQGSLPTFTNVMIRDASIIDSTFEPFHPSVEQTLRDAEVIEGKNKLHIPDSVVTSGIYTINRNSDGEVTSIVANGNVSSTQWILLKTYPAGSLPLGRYALSGCPSGGSASTYKLMLRENPVGTFSQNDYGEGVTFEITDVTKEYQLYIGVYATVSNKEFKPMLCTEEEWNKSHDFEPYYIPLKDSKFDRAEQRVLGAKNLLENKGITQTVNGITYTVNSDGSITANGTATASADLIINQGFQIAEKCIMTGCPTGGSSSTYRLMYTSYGGAGIEYADIGNGIEINNIPIGTSPNVRVVFRVSNGQTVNNITIKPMIRLASDPDDTYAPYAMTNRELTEKKSGTVTAGTIEGNATLEDSQYVIIGRSCWVYLKIKTTDTYASGGRINLKSTNLPINGLGKSVFAPCFPKSGVMAFYRGNESNISFSNETGASIGANVELQVSFCIPI